MALDKIKQPEGAITEKWIIGRGRGSGTGRRCGYGHKGAKNRSGRGKGYGSGFEGGQTKTYRRFPKIRGWRNEIVNPVRVAELNLTRLNTIPANTEVNLDVLRSYDLAKKTDNAYKILGTGEIKIALNFKGAYATKTAVKAIQDAGGTIEIQQPKPPLVRHKNKKQGA